MFELGLLPATLAKLGMAVLLGSLIGLERELRGRPAGLRTMMLVCLGSTMVMVVSHYLSVASWTVAEQHVVRVDPGRVAAGIVTGVGFLGGAVVIKLGDIVRGVTTAAGIWFVASLGIVLGQGHFALASVATVGALGILWGLHLVERLLKGQVYRVLHVETETDTASPAPSPDEIQALAKESGLRVMDTCIDVDVAAKLIHVKLSIRARGQLRPAEVVHRIAARPGVRRVSWGPQM